MEVPVENIIDSVDLTANDALLPLFECVANSVISTKKTNNAQKYIQIQIERGDYPSNPDIFNTRTIKNIAVIDNGEGFTDKNLKSFETPFSKINKEFGCKGVGRFTVLASFRRMRVRSNYRDSKGWMYREFEFDPVQEVHPIILQPSSKEEHKTIVELEECFNPTIKDRTAKTLDEIAQELMDHCLVYYLCGDLPKIELYDSTEKKVEKLNDLYDRVSRDKEKKFTLNGEEFHIYITKTPKENNRKNHYIRYCANSRTVGMPKSIGKLNTVFAYPIVQNGIAYFLDVYVVSDYLNNNTYSSRNGFKIPQEKGTSLFGKDSKISFDEIENKIISIIEVEYNPHVKATRERNKKELQEYIMNEAPRYNSFLRNPDILDSIPPNLSNDKKEEYLYKLSFEARKKVDENINRFISQKQISKNAIEAIRQELKDKTAYDADSLADYMFRRKAIINLFDKFLEADRDGKYKLEEDIHNLIFPMGVTNDEVNYESHNLWLLDERFATYKFIASDKSITSFCQKKSSKEPDIIMMNENPKMFENPICYGNSSAGEISSMVIFEFKRPGDTAHQKNKTDYRWEYSELVEKYFEDFLYNPDKKNYKGKQVIIDKTTPKFGYVILDVIPKPLETYNQDKGWHKTPFGSFYKMLDGLNLHIEVMTFSKLIETAQKRHNPFFDKLFAVQGKS